MNFLKRICVTLVHYDFFWLLLKPLVRVGSFLQWARNLKTDRLSQLERQRLNEIKFRKMFADGLVLHGPFKGLKYPSLDSAGSSFSPKLLGSYEKELHDVIERICGHHYEVIVNIGAAEGYYAVGLARRLPQTRIYAFDMAEEARRLCKEMCVANNVNDNVIVESECTPSVLAELVSGKNALVICDCEGCESIIFTPDILSALRGSDVLVETHDFVDITISTRLKKLFERTHHVETILSCDDIQKAKHYDFPELLNLDLSERFEILKEKRPAIMEWLFFTRTANG